MQGIRRFEIVAGGLALLLGAADGAAQRNVDTPVAVAKQGYFFVGGHYDDPANPTSMSGQMYVEYQIPARQRRGAYPIVLVHGGAHSGAGYVSTPNGREGWADYFLRNGWPVYNVDQVGRAKSPYVDSVYGARSFPSIRQAEDLWAASEKADPSVQWPQANLHTQWPGTGSHTHGDPVFDQYFSHLSPGIADGALQEELTAQALVALVDKLGPSIMLIHSQPGTAIWRVGDMRPDLVKAILAVEPSGPPFYASADSAGTTVVRPYGPSIGALTYEPAVSDPAELNIVREDAPDGPGLIRCWLQGDSPRQLPHLAGLPILMLLSESSYHAPYDHCTSKYLTQAGVEHDFIRLPEIGLHGNGHIQMAEKNNLKIAGVMERWLIRKLAVSDARVATGPFTGSVGTLRIASQGAFFVGGQYDDPAAPTTMFGQMYVRYQIPEHARPDAVPVVMIHGGGQQTTTFTGTPDDRSGWADYYLKRGYPVYVVDQPGRGRSPYLDSIYGPRGVPDLPGLEDRFTATERAKLWPQAALHSQWPGSGLHGDSAFDQFFASQWAGMNATDQERYTSRALVKLLQRIGPSVLLTHSQSGPHGWLAADQHPELVRGIIAVEPNGPPFYEMNFIGAPDWFSYGDLGRPYGITRLPLRFQPEIADPAALSPVLESRADGPDKIKCYLQSEPAHRLPRLARVPVVIVTSEASFRATYDHCTVRFLQQAGVPATHVRLEDHGIHGNGHMMMLEENNLAIAQLLVQQTQRMLRSEGAAAVADAGH
jgi:pimeloyl-ACP methyl ester carboxylesterase